MRLLISALFCLLGFQYASADVPARALSSHKDFTIRSSFGAGARVYYNCDSVENTVEDMLSRMGARNIRVRCTGGIDDFRIPSDAYVEVSFRSLRVASRGDRSARDADWRRVRIRSFDDCYLRQQIFENVRNAFSLRDVRVSSYCSQPGSPFRAEFTTLFP